MRQPVDPVVRDPARQDNLLSPLFVKFHRQGGPGSVRLRFGDQHRNGSSGSGFLGSGGSSKEGGFCVFQCSLTEDGSGSGFGSWKTVPAVPVPRSVPGKTVPTVPVSGSGSVPGPP